MTEGSRPSSIIAGMTGRLDSRFRGNDEISILSRVTRRIDYARLPTERVNRASAHIDRLSVRRALEIINHEDAAVPRAVRRALPSLERAVQVIVRSLRGGGRLLFIGAGTSGRLGVMEAAECPPTFNTPRSLVQAV